MVNGDEKNAMQRENAGFTADESGANQELRENPRFSASKRRTGGVMEYQEALATARSHLATGFIVAAITCLISRPPVLNIIWLLTVGMGFSLLMMELKTLGILLKGRPTNDY